MTIWNALSTNLPQITHITPEASKQATIQYETGASISPSAGPIPTTFPSARLQVGQGRFYNLEDQIQRARVAVIGSEAKDKLFSGRNALGERIRINGLSFEVIGILSAKMQEGDDDINRIIYIPFTTMGDLKDTHYLDSIWFNYETPEYSRLEQSAARHPGHRNTSSIQTDTQAVRIFNLMVQVHQFEIITWD